MEIDVTAFSENADPFEFESRGRSQRRPANMGKCKGGGATLAASDYVREFGAWSEEEIAAWGPIECNALLIQLISGDIREGDLDCEEPDWKQYEKDAENGQCSGNIFKADDGKIYYSLSP